MALPVFDPMEQRILGSLLEKQVTVPASYPMTMKALRTACNQASSRDPVVAYAEPELERCLREMERREVVRLIWPSGSRTVKYAEAIDRVLDLDAAERAILTVLLLRGAQAPGELRTRTDRLHTFADRDEVSAVLRSLAERDEPLVTEMALRPREQDRRWVHLLGPQAEPDAVPDTAPPESGDAAVADAVIARRTFVSSQGEIHLELHRPEPASDGGYRCHFRIDGVGSDSIDGSAHGVDGVDALGLALVEAQELLVALEIGVNFPGHADPVLPNRLTGSS